MIQYRLLTRVKAPRHPLPSRKKRPRNLSWSPLPLPYRSLKPLRHLKNPKVPNRVLPFIRWLSSISRVTLGDRKLAPFIRFVVTIVYILLQSQNVAMNQSFSSIVGPNGSGKSNTIDALLFVFGYRASKMRQGKLSELIHNSARYPDLDECSVEVHFREIIDLVYKHFYH